VTQEQLIRRGMRKTKRLERPKGTDVTVTGGITTERFHKPPSVTQRCLPSQRAFEAATFFREFATQRTFELESAQER
jgi:hypothetical protein